VGYPTTAAIKDRPPTRCCRPPSASTETEETGSGSDSAWDSGSLEAKGKSEAKKSIEMLCIVGWVAGEQMFVSWSDDEGARLRSPFMHFEFEMEGGRDKMGAL
jgi:hypothetical protein